MKRAVLTILAVCIFLSMLSTLSIAGELPKPPLRVVVNWDEIKFPDEKPYIDENSRTQTPARFIGEAFGAEVTWDQPTKTALFVKGSNKLEIYIGKKNIG